MSDRPLHERAQQRLYGTGAPAGARPPAMRSLVAETVFDRQERQAQQLYGAYRRVTASYYDRRAARFNRTDDAENVRLTRAEQAKMRDLAQKAEVSEEALNTLLTVQHEYDEFPRGAEAREVYRQRTPETLRLKLGSSEARDQVISDYLRATAVLDRELPAFGARMRETGSEFDIRNVEALAPLGARIRELEQAAKPK